ncbi:MAG TPA: methionyl-tRNA formyltransferase [Burkholderiaceae bacterium]|nr:methionyl-tRNA formyltransferase [Burkholderiaceae bacterium]
MRVVFAGTPEFAAAALKALLAAGAQVPLVLTQPDRPAGRGMKLTAPPVKEVALAAGVAVAQPRSLRLDGKYPDDAAAARDALHAVAPDVMVVAAYGLILPQWVLELPRAGCVNLHGSLLPRWRGAAPIHRAIEAGDAETGITLMQMDAGLDTGAMLTVERTAIAPTDTTSSLHDRLADLGAFMIVRDLPGIVAGRIAPRAQPDEGITYAEKIRKEEAPIDWTQAAAAIERRMRAFDPFPGCSTRFADHELKLWRASVVPLSGAPGEVLACGKHGFVVACGEAALEVTEVQRAGGKRQNAGEWARAAGLEPGARFAY